MTGARHLRRTVFSRIRDLLRAGAITRKPLWYDVVEAFPPFVQTKVNRKPEPGRVQKIEFPEDVFRSKFYRTFHSLELLDLEEGKHHNPRDCERFVDKCQELVEQGIKEEEAFEEVSLLFTKGDLTENKGRLSEEVSSMTDYSEDKPAITNIYELLKEKGLMVNTKKGTDT